MRRKKANVNPSSESGKKKLRKKIVKRKNDSFFVVCVGASAGGLNAINELVSSLPAQLNAAVLIVLHLSKAALGEILAERIKRHSALPCKVARDKEKIQPGTIYIAQPGAHLLVKEDRVLIGNGPPENRFRPSIDVLFRSVAGHYGQRTIGVVLTGLLNDGTTGMWAIRQSGGYTIVQDPNEAEYPDMPLSVVETLDVDYCIPLAKMGETISKITTEGVLKSIKAPANILAESRLSEKAATSIAEVQMLGEKTLFACPDCGGGLWDVKNGGVKHYRCHIGHSFTEKDLILKQTEAIEQTIWVAVRMMEERKLLLLKMARDKGDAGLHHLSDSSREQAGVLEMHIERLKELLFSMDK